MTSGVGDDLDGKAEVIANDGQLPGGFYKRAWEIVNHGQNDYKLVVFCGKIPETLPDNTSLDYNG